MPVTPEYGWEETESAVTVHVALAGVSRKALDVFATEALVKVNAPPYLCHIDLAYDVDDSKTTATIDDKGVTFRLVKKEPGLWGKLGADGEKEAVARRREASVDAAHARANAAREAALKKKQKDEKLLSDQQMELESSKRRLIEQRKREEFNAEAEGLKQWQASLHDPAANDSDTESEDEVEATGLAASEEPAMADHPHYHGKGWRAAKEAGESEVSRSEQPTSSAPDRSKARNTVWVGDDSDSDSGDAGVGTRSSSGTDSSDDEDGDVGGRRPSAEPFRPMPPPRRAMEAVQVEFTKLETETLPARENREIELKEYKRQQRELASTQDSADVSDRQPVFLKDKGDALYGKGNFRGALNAYSRALQVEPDHLPSLANRSACWLKLGDAEQCIADCDTAITQVRPLLERLQPSDAASGEVRKLHAMFVRLLARKGAAHCQLEQLAEALSAYEEAAKAAPGDETLALNVEEVRAAMQPADVASLRRRADARVKANDPIGGAEAYGILLSFPDLTHAERLAALSNRSVCYLMAGDFQLSINDCNAALVMLLEGLGVAGMQHLHTWAEEKLLQEVPKSADGGSLPEEWNPHGSRRRSFQRLLARRGAANSHLRRYEQAVLDLSTAAKLCAAAGDATQAASLEADAARISELMGPSEAAPPASECNIQDELD